MRTELWNGHAPAANNVEWPVAVRRMCDTAADDAAPLTSTRPQMMKRQCRLVTDTASRAVLSGVPGFPEFVRRQNGGPRALRLQYAQ